ncbi:MAG: phospholipase D-like domain-containing protein [Myxococcales bacterium]|nr:phospholipase D-like domain-containing protein [Myxococcales bacterium]
MRIGSTGDAYGQLRNIFGSTAGFETLVSGNRVTLLHDGEQAFPAMLKAIEAAEREILLEMYWFGSDKVGRQFAEALSSQAKAGLRVRVIYDAVGSIQSDGRMFARMRDAGCEVEQYNPIAPWRARFRIGVVNHRDHRKLLIIDRRVGFTGGINLADEWAPDSAGGGGWRDDTIRIEGPAVEQMRNIFVHAWRRIVEPGDGGKPSMPPVVEIPEEEGSRVRVLANQYFGERRAIRRAYLSRIANAKRSVSITNSYFIPDSRIRRVLRQAAKRGVDVRVIIPGKSDLFPARYAGRRLYGRLLRGGIKLFEWQRSILHSKTAIVDGEWCTVGTYNLDYRSWRFNLEVVAAIEDAAVAGAMERRFNEDLEQAKPISYAQWRRRPLLVRVLDRFFYLFRKML